MKIAKIANWGMKKNKIKVHLEIGKKGHENNKNWEITKIEDGGWKKKKKKK